MVLLLRGSCQTSQEMKVKSFLPLFESCLTWREIGLFVLFTADGISIRPHLCCLLFSGGSDGSGLCVDFGS